MSEAEQALCFLAGANSIFAGDKLLTTPNPGVDRDQLLFERLGLTPRPRERLTDVRPSASADAAASARDLIDRLGPITDAPRVVVTGIGLITGLGARREETWAAPPGGPARRSEPRRARPARDRRRTSAVPSRHARSRAADGRCSRPRREAFGDAGLSEPTPIRPRPRGGRDRAEQGGPAAGSRRSIAALRRASREAGGRLGRWLAGLAARRGGRGRRDVWDLRGPCLAPVAACATGLVAALAGGRPDPPRGLRPRPGRRGRRLARAARARGLPPDGRPRPGRRRRRPRPRRPALGPRPLGLPRRRRGGRPRPGARGPRPGAGRLALRRVLPAGRSGPTPTTRPTSTPTRRTSPA